MIFTFWTLNLDRFAFERNLTLEVMHNDNWLSHMLLSPAWLMSISTLLVGWLSSYSSFLSLETSPVPTSIFFLSAFSNCSIYCSSCSLLALKSIWIFLPFSLAYNKVPLLPDFLTARSLLDNYFFGLVEWSSEGF